MAAQKSKTTYREYLDFFLKEAQDRGWSGTRFMSVCGFPKQRLSEWKHVTKPFTSYYFIRLCEGLRITGEYVEKKTGMRFSDEQKDALRGKEKKRE